MMTSAPQIADIVIDALLVGDVRAAILIAKESPRVTLDGPPRGLLMIGHERSADDIDDALFLGAFFARRERDIGVLCHALLRETTLEEFDKRIAPIEMAFERRGTVRWVSLFDTGGVLVRRQRVEPDVVMDIGVTAQIQRTDG